MTDSIFSQRIQPEHLTYLGAFRLPETASDSLTWDFSGAALTYYQQGDPSGSSDGFPGSIFGAGHDWYMFISEIDIPAPVISVFRDVNELPTANTLQPFQNVRKDLFQDQFGSKLFTEIIRVGMEYLPPQGSQNSGKLHLTWGQHNQFQQDPSHMWSELDLSNPQSKGGWYFNELTNYVTNDYLFEIPADWSDIYLPGFRLACGRFRDGGWGGQGPALFAYKPWQTDSPPADGDTIQTITPLLLYGIHQPGQAEIIIADSMKMDNYKEADEWTGGAWLSSGSFLSVILVGTKGLGNCWYGLPDGSLWEPPYPPDPFNQRGWWCEEFQAQILFFDPGELAATALGQLAPYKPQPYAAFNLDPYLFSVDSTQEKDHVGAVSFDRENGYLYIIERRADGDKSLIHVFSVDCGCDVKESQDKPLNFELQPVFPNPFNSSTTLGFTLFEFSYVRCTVYDLLGREILILLDERKPAGNHSISWYGTDTLGEIVESGVYFLRFQADDSFQIQKLILLK